MARKPNPEPKKSGDIGTPRQAGELFGVHAFTMKRRALARALPKGTAWRIGNSYRFDLAALRAWRDSGADMETKK